MRTPVRLVRFSWFLILPILCLGLSLPALSADRAVKLSTDAIEARLAEDIRVIASDEMEGRGPGTKGIDKAADYIAKNFAELGLKTAVFGDSPFQKFKLAMSTELGPKDKNHITFVGPPDESGKPRTIELKLDTEFTPLSQSGSGKFDLPVVFVGYGITGKKEMYDDYAGLDVKGKAVILMRREPQQANPHSAFNGTSDSEHAAIPRKVANAYEHGAEAVFLCTDNFDIQKNVAAERKKWQDAIDKLSKADAEFRKIEKPTQPQVEEHRKKIDDLAAKISAASKSLSAAYDPLASFTTGGPSEGRSLPVVHCRRAPLDKLLSGTLMKDLAELEKEIDDGPAPHSAELEGWRVQGETNVLKKEVEVKNVAAILEGEGEHADETIVIGAHYDHVGRGGPGSGSLAKDSTDIHNGADDNGSGTVALLEVARELASRETKLPRRIMFIAFTGEERGLLGSARYCKEPAIPLDKTIAMLNMDMVGRLKDEKLIVYGTGTATQFDEMVDRYGKKYEFSIKKDPSGIGPSDHASFYTKKVPVLHYFTGMHPEYHRPTDKYDKINVPGMRRVAEMVVETAVEIANTERRPEYQETKRTASRDTSNARPYFGAIPDYTPDVVGLPLTGVAKDSPAEQGGLKANDVVIKLGESRIGNIEDFDSALRKHKAGDKVEVVVKRDKEEVKLEVTLGTPR